MKLLCFCIKKEKKIIPIDSSYVASESFYSKPLHSEFEIKSKDSDNSALSNVSIISYISSIAANSLNSSKSNISSIKMPEFYIKNSFITIHDYLALHKSWEMILNNELYIFHNLKQRDLTYSFDSLNWFYETFFAVLNNEDIRGMETMEVRDELNKIFDSNIRVQSKSLIQLIKYTIFMAKCEARCMNGLAAASTVPANFENMFKAHMKIGMSLNTYLYICKCLIITIERCFEYDWNADIIIGWKKVLSYSIDHVAPYYKNYIRHKVKEFLNNSMKSTTKDKSTIHII